MVLGSVETVRYWRGLTPERALKGLGGCCAGGGGGTFVGCKEKGSTLRMLNRKGEALRMLNRKG